MQFHTPLKDNGLLNINADIVHADVLLLVGPYTLNKLHRQFKAFAKSEDNTAGSFTDRPTCSGIHRRL